MTVTDNKYLDMIEANDPSPLVQRLIGQIRELQDEVMMLQIAKDEALDEVLQLKGLS